MKSTFLLFVFTLILSSLSHASPVRVAFIEIRTPAGRVVQLEPGGQFAHVALSYGDKWLHVYPGRGVEVISRAGLSKIGEIKLEKVISNKEEPTSTFVESVVGVPYDDEFSWSDTKLYCSELVAKFLGVPPRPMYFDSKLWPEKFTRLNGLPGMSPDGLYALLVGASQR